VERLPNEPGSANLSPTVISIRGLMIAPYKEINDRQVAALATAVERTPSRMEDIARAVSEAYIGTLRRRRPAPTPRYASEAS